MHRKLRYFCLLLAAIGAFFTPAAQAQQALLIPEGFEMQELEPSFGRILRPKDWQYLSHGTEGGWRWTIAQQDPKINYETGVKIDLLLQVEETTQITKQDFAYNFLLEKQRNATVLSECPEAYLDKFVRKCLEVIEDVPNTNGRQRRHALYTVYWGITLNMVAISVFTTPERNWKNVRHIADTMSRFEPVGQKPKD